MGGKQRGRLYVDKDVQSALLWQLFRHWATFIAILAGTLLVLEAFRAGPQHSLGGYVQATWTRYAPLFVVIAALFPAFAYDSIKLSHRFVGPIVRLRRALREAALGEPVEPVHFRKTDFWQDMAETFNAVVERLPAPSADAKTAGRASSKPAPGDRHEAAAAKACEV